MSFTGSATPNRLRLMPHRLNLNWFGYAEPVRVNMGLPYRQTGAFFSDVKSYGLVVKSYGIVNMP